MGLRYLVTGAAGFIGRHASRMLKERGHEVTTSDIKGEVDIITDLSDTDWSKFELGRFDGVVHLGALTSVPESIDKPDEYKIVNEKGTMDLFSSCVENAVPVVVFASTAAAYGDSDASIKVVGDEGEIGSRYAKTKIAGEMSAKELGSDSTRFVCLRFFNVYGPGQSTDSSYAAVIPNFIERAIVGDDLEIFGDGTQTRDFVHVFDVVRAIIGSIERNIGKFVIVNVGSGNGITINSLAETIVSIVQSRGFGASKIIYKEIRQGDVLHSVADISGLQDLIGMKQMRPLDEGLEELIDYYIDSRLAGDF